jgi:hypothetical protein
LFVLLFWQYWGLNSELGRPSTTWAIMTALVCFFLNRLSLFCWIHFYWLNIPERNVIEDDKSGQNTAVVPYCLSSVFQGPSSFGVLHISVWRWACYKLPQSSYFAWEEKSVTQALWMDILNKVRMSKKAVLCNDCEEKNFLRRIKYWKRIFREFWVWQTIKLSP